MKYFLWLILIVAIQSDADIYECVREDGKSEFSDRACKAGTKEKLLYSNSSKWIKQLKSHLPSGISIEKMTQEDQDVRISYWFESLDDSTDFLRLVNKFSSTPVTITKILLPKEGAKGYAKMLVSNKPNPLWDKMKNERK